MTATATATATYFEGYVEVQLPQQPLGSWCKRIQKLGGSSGTPHTQYLRFLKVPTTVEGMATLSELITEFSVDCLIVRPTAGRNDHYPHFYPLKAKVCFETWFAQMVQKYEVYAAQRAAEKAQLDEESAQRRYAAKEELLLTLLGIDDVREQITKLAEVLETHTLQHLTDLLSRKV